MGTRREIVLVMALLLVPLCGRAVAGDDEVPRENPPEPAFATVSEAAAPRRDWEIYGVAGLGTPVGSVGLEGIHRFGGPFELSVGVGNGMAAALAQPKGSFGHALQWSVMPRVRLGEDSAAFTFGVGLSGGEYALETGFCPGCSDGEDRPSPTYPTFYTLWTNFELGGEHVSGSGLAFRYFLGLAAGYKVEAGKSLPFPVPYLGVGLGYAF